MGMNIKSEEAHRLARELAKLTGESLTDAVTESLRLRLRRIRREGKAERILVIGREIAARRKTPWPDIDELLYDERGLPK